MFYVMLPLRLQLLSCSSEDGRQEICVPSVASSALSKYGESLELLDISLGAGCKGNLTALRRKLDLDLAKGNPKRTL
jgi:hypothetical protein